MNTAAPLHERVRSVTERIRARSAGSRGEYLERTEDSRRSQVNRAALSCTNLAHGFAAMDPTEKERLRGVRWANVAIVSSYNDMLSAHQPYGRYPEQMKIFAREVGATAQVAGGVPAESRHRLPAGLSGVFGLRTGSHSGKGFPARPQHAAYLESQCRSQRRGGSSRRDA